MKKTLEKSENTNKISILDAIVTADKIEAKETEWIIPHAIPRGGLTLVCGREECGKSTLLTQLCVDLAKGKKTVLDGEESQERKAMKVLYIDAEESAATVGMRLRKLGANSNVAVLDKKHPLVAEMTTTSDSMRELVAGYRPDLLVLAPISSFLPEKCKATSKKDVVMALRPLMDLADQYNCAIVILQHTNKAESADYRKCIADSSYFSEAPRSIIMMNKTGKVGEVFASVEKGSLSSVYDPYETRLLRFEHNRQALELVGTTSKKWRDFVLQAQGRDIAETAKAAAAAEKKSKLTETQDIIVQVLTEHDGAMERSELIAETVERGASTGVWERARKALIDDGVIVADTVSRGQSRMTTYRLAEDSTLCIDLIDEGGAA